MTINDPSVQVQAIQPRIPRWTGTKKLITIGAATMVAVASTSAVVQWSRAETEQPAVQTPAVPMTRDEKVQDLVDRGLIPAPGVGTGADDEG